MHCKLHPHCRNLEFLQPVLIQVLDIDTLVFFQYLLGSLAAGELDADGADLQLEIKPHARTIFWLNLCKMLS